MAEDKYYTYDKIIHSGNKSKIDELIEDTELEGVRYCLLLANSNEYPFIADYFDLLRCFRVSEPFTQVACIRISSGHWEKQFHIKDAGWHNFSEKLLPIHFVELPIKIECDKRLEVIGVKLCSKTFGHESIDLEEYGFRKSFTPVYEYDDNDWTTKSVTANMQYYDTYNKWYYEKYKKEVNDRDYESDEDTIVDYKKSNGDSSDDDDNDEYYQTQVYYDSDCVFRSDDSSSLSESSRSHHYAFYDSD